MASTDFRNLQPLLAPRGIAVVGASPRGNRGSRVLENLARFRFPGEVVVVNPGYDEVFGRRSVPSVADLPEDIDLLVVAVGAERALEVVRQAGERSIRGLVVIGSGFGEGAKDGDRSRELAALIDKHAMVACGPNCYGSLDIATGAAAYSGRIVDPLPAGNVALVLQSGALTHAITDSALGRGLAVSAIVTTGNEVSATVSDYISWYAEDPATRVIGVFVEGLRDARKFAEACARARARGTSVIVLASGRSERGRRAAMAHTGAISGGAAALDGLLATVGAVRVDDVDEFREALLLFSGLADRPASSTSGVAALSISGGACGLTADAAETIDLALPAFAPATVGRLVARLPDFAVVNNPLDVTGGAAEDPEILTSALRIAAEDPAVGVVAFVMNVGLASPDQRDFYRTQGEILARLAATSAKPLVLITLPGGALDPEILALTHDAGVPVLMGLRPALKALRAWLAWPSHAWREETPVVEPACWPSEHDVVAGGEALDALVGAGVQVAPYVVAGSPAEVAEAAASMASRIVLKIESPDIAHKTEVGGIRLGVAAETAQTEAAALLADVAAAAPEARIDGVLVQEMVSGARLECLVGVVEDAQVGLSVSITPGGVLAELLGPAAARPAPLTPQDADELIDASVLATLLAGYRGGPALDRTALVDAAVRFSRLAASLPRLAAAEMNPLLVGEAGHGVIAVDCLLVRAQD